MNRQTAWEGVAQKMTVAGQTWCCWMLGQTLGVVCVCLEVKAALKSRMHQRYWQRGNALPKEGNERLVEECSDNGLF